MFGFVEFLFLSWLFAYSPIRSNFNLLFILWSLLSFFRFFCLPVPMLMLYKSKFMRRGAWRCRFLFFFYFIFNFSNKKQLLLLSVFIFFPLHYHICSSTSASASASVVVIYILQNVYNVCALFEH